MQSTVIVLQSLATIVLGLLVLFRNSRQRLYQSFFLLSIVSGMWILFSGLGGRVENMELSRNLIQMDYLTGYLLGWSLWYFSFQYLEEVEVVKQRTQRYMRILLPFGLVVFIKSIFKIDIVNNDAVVTEGSLFLPLYVIPLIVLAFVSIKNLRRAYRHASSEVRKQASVIYKSLFASVLFVLPSSLLLEMLLGSQVSSDLIQTISNLGLLIFLAGSTYAIIRHRFFDIRLVFARSIAFVFALSFWAIVYSVVVFVVIRNILGEDFFNNFSDRIYFLLALFLATTFQPISNFFKSLTNSIFFQDNYDPQQELNKLSNVLVSSYEIDSIAHDSINILKDTLNPEKGKLILLGGEGEYYDDYSLNNTDKIEFEEFLNSSDIQKEIVVSVDRSDLKHTALMNTLKRIDISISVKLETNEGVVGFLLLGTKRSGGRYTSQDIRFLRIVGNELSIAIQNARRYDEIKRFNETLRLEVDRATAELRESNRKLKELDEAKDEFVTMASHQLRTPLTSVKGYISMVMEGDAGKITKRQEELLANAFTSSQRMVYLIADLLNVSRLRTGKFMIDAREVNLKDIIESEIDQLKETAKSRGLTLKFNAPKSFPNTMLDEEKIRQVIMNFIDNAIYYTPSKGKIEVNLESTDKEIKMTVKDNGIGVPKQDRPNLFTKFYRAGNARKARPDGTGLGLFMAKKVVVAQGGAIVFDSKEGQGSTFGFTFPLSRVGIKDKKSSKKSKKSDATEKK